RPLRAGGAAELQEVGREGPGAGRVPRALGVPRRSPPGGGAMSITAVIALLLAAPAEPAASPVDFQAARTDQPITLDGKLDEAAWSSAPAFESFVQIFPTDGAAPSERTLVRVLYDDDNLYVGVECLDSKPELILHRLARRDQMPASDRVEV